MIKKRLKETRKAHGLTQQSIADYLGVDRTTYTYYETGAICPSVENLKKISELYRISVAYLIGETNDAQPVTSNGVYDQVAENVDFAKTLTKNEKVLITYFRSLEDEKKAEVLSQLRTVVLNNGNKKMK